MKNPAKVFLSILTSIALITGCQSVGQLTQLTPKSPLLQREGTSIEFSLPSNSSATTVKGKVEFTETNSPLRLPSLGKRGDGGEFSSPSSPFTTQALLSDIAPSATVSLLYPPNHPTNPNVTVATGLTDTTGNFLINPSSTFAPAVNDIFILEAEKRVGGNGNALLTLRTYIRWNGTNWDSITNPGIYINTKTTALTIISGLNPSLITPLQTIGTMSVVNGVSAVDDITGTNVTSIMINDVKDLVTTVLSSNYDPVQYINFTNGQFNILNPGVVNIPLPTNVIYVNANAVGNNDGTSWANAYTSLQSALSAASSGKDIWVALGTYKPTTGTDVSATFQLKNGVNIYGGFSGTETRVGQRNFKTNVVILSGDLNNSNSANSGDSYHVVTGVTGATLDGVSIKFGYANGTSPDNSGGGMYNNNSSPILTNVNFSANSATGNDPCSSYGGGGGMYNNNSSPILTNVNFSYNSVTGSYSYGGGGMQNYNNSSPILTNVIFSNNSTDTGGGGMESHNSSSTLINVTFSYNSTARGGAGISNYKSPSTLTNVTFSNNSTVIGGGGGMQNFNSSPSILTNVTFSNNYSGDGGGMYNSISSSTLTNVIFTNNSTNSGGKGGGMYNYSSRSTLTNVTFSNNSAYDGGGLYNFVDSTSTLTNVTFSSNLATNEGGGLYNSESSSAIKNVTFSGNSSKSEGGGMFNYASSSYKNVTLENVTFSNNSVTGFDNSIASSYGGGMYNLASSSASHNVTLENVTFSNNSVTGSNSNGGGMYNGKDSPSITNVTFSNNSANNGGGMYNYASSPVITNVIFSGNSAIHGGGMSSGGNDSYGEYSFPVITNVTFSGNSATYGGGIYNFYYSSPTLTNVSFFKNSATNGNGGGIYNTYSSITNVKNAIFWGNTAGVGNIKNSIYNYSSTLKIGYSDVEEGFSGISGGWEIKDITGKTTLNATNFSTAGNNINADPLFLNSLNLAGADGIFRTSDDGLSLQSGSPARNTGTATGAPSKDIAGVTRPKGSGFDMGAYESVE